jgi:hypothetical protein
MTNRIIYYYQTFVGLKNVLEQDPTMVTDIFISSIHFGYNINGNPYIHLNDYPPTNDKFDSVWQESSLASALDINIHLMLGGAGGAFQDLFSNYEIFYPMLVNLIKSHTFIKGINLDIEEEVPIKDIQNLIHDLVCDFGEKFIISLAPISYALMNDVPGMAGFKIKDLLNSSVGKYIDFMNGQFYGDFDLESYQKVIENGYDPKQIVIGMLSDEFDKNNISELCKTVKSIKKMYPDFAGVFTWEYFSAPPDSINHAEWAKYIYNSINYDELDCWKKIKFDLYLFSREINNCFRGKYSHNGKYLIL